MKKQPGEEAFNNLVANVKDLYRRDDGSTTITDDEAYQAANRLIRLGRLAVEIHQTK